MDTEYFRKLLVDERERVSSTVENLHESNSRSFEEETEEDGDRTVAAMAQCLDAARAVRASAG